MFNLECTTESTENIEQFRQLFCSRGTERGAVSLQELFAKLISLRKPVKKLETGEKLFTYLTVFILILGTIYLAA